MNELKHTSEKLKSIGIVRPTLIVDREQALNNIIQMTSKAKRANVIFRPHFKTHQSAEIGYWFRKHDVNQIAVSSVTMAKYFALNGWDDITIAINSNPLEIDMVNLLSKTKTVGILVDSEPLVDWLNIHINAQINVFIKIDTGLGRTGISWKDTKQLVHVARKIKCNPLMNFLGILTHAGHSYGARNSDEIKAIHHTSIERMVEVKSHILATDIDSCIISIGDTPTCTLAEDFTGADEIRPGNFIFHDLMQVNLGVCNRSDIAVAVACPVIGKYTDRNQIVIYGGAIHFSKDYFIKGEDQIFGELAQVVENRIKPIQEHLPLRSLSQEHGIINVDKDVIKTLNLGDLVLIYPAHSCLTCNLYSEYKDLDGKILDKI